VETKFSERTERKRTGAASPRVSKGSSVGLPEATGIKGLLRKLVSILLTVAGFKIFTVEPGEEMFCRLKVAVGRRYAQIGVDLNKNNFTSMAQHNKQN
jgi:hypothetical protein